MTTSLAAAWITVLAKRITSTSATCLGSRSLTRQSRPTRSCPVSTIEVGTDIQPYQSLRNQAPFSPHGQFSFGNNYSNFTISDFLLGYPSQAARSIAKAVNNHDGRFINFFVQDDYRITQKLTLNLGLRYEHHQLPTDRRDVGASLV